MDDNIALVVVHTFGVYICISLDEKIRKHLVHDTRESFNTALHGQCKCGEGGALSFICRCATRFRRTQDTYLKIHHICSYVHRQANGQAHTYIRKDYCNVNLLVNNALIVEHCFGNLQYATRVQHIFKRFINKMN